MKTANGLERKKTVYSGHELPAVLPDGFALHDLYFSSVRRSKDGTWFVTYRIEFLGQDDERIVYKGTRRNSNLEALTTAFIAQLKAYGKEVTL